MRQWFIRLSEVAEFSDSFVPFRENPNKIIKRFKRFAIFLLEHYSTKDLISNSRIGWEQILNPAFANKRAPTVHALYIRKVISSYCKCVFRLRLCWIVESDEALTSYLAEKGMDTLSPTPGPIFLFHDIFSKFGC